VIIAVDGPGGSGKSTISRLLAQRHALPHLDTGAFYRAATLAVLEEGVDPIDQSAVVQAVRPRRFEQKNGRLLMDGVDVSAQIRTPQVTAQVSAVSAHPRLRQLMVALQRAWVADQGGSAVVEGRDIGTVVFPEAELKVWLTADPAERARRRALETGADQRVVAADLVRRDQYDASRPISPQRPAEDAVVIDTTGLSIEEVVERISVRVKA
jgi:cytidylate kinase